MDGMQASTRSRPGGGGSLAFLQLPARIPTASRLFGHAIDRTAGAEQTARALNHGRPSACFMNASRNTRKASTALEMA
jgi:hypothetical protein